MASKNLAILIFLACLVRNESRTCNPLYLSRATTVLATKENFVEYPWLTFTPTKGTVKYMEVKNALVPQLCKFSFPNNVMEVILINIRLAYIEPGFFQSKTLRQAVIMSNDLTSISRGVFNGTTISSLILSENNIRTIEPGAFEDMKSLEAIALDHNEIQIYEPDWFSNAKMLYEVSFQHNNLTELPEGTTKNMAETQEVMAVYVKLGSVNFDGNQIRHIHPEAFGNLRTFGTISLSDNKLLELPPLVFLRIKFLFDLKLANNNFICLSDSSLNSLHGVRRLFLENNIMNTDCVERIKEFFEWKNDVVFF